MSDFCSILGSGYLASACRSIKNGLFYSEKSEGNESTSRCGVSKQGPTIQQKSESDAQITLPPFQVGDARVGGEGGITINDAGVVEIRSSDLIKKDRHSAQGTDIYIANVRLTMPAAGSKTIKIVVETYPETLKPVDTNVSLAGLDGLIDVEPVLPKPGKTIQVNGKNGPITIKDPRQAQNRAPVYMGGFTLQDNTGKISTITQETCSATALLNPQAVNDAGVTQNCESYRIQANGSQNAYEFIVPKEAYAKDNSLDINYSFTLRVNSKNMDPGHKYMLYLKARLVVGGQVVDSGIIAVDTGASLDAGVPAPDTAPDAGMPDAGMPDKGTSQ
jgi:hypothetical protein